MARPRRNGIDRFNVSTELTQNKKFIRFKRAIGLSDGLAYLHVVRFFEFVAVNHAFDPTIDPEDAEIIADFCFYQGPGERLLKALQDAGFLTSDWRVHDWEVNQPLAEKLINKRRAGSEGGQKTADARAENALPRDEFGKFSPKQNGENPASASGLGKVPPKPTPNSELRIPNQIAKPSKASDAREPSKLPSSNGTFVPSPELTLLANDLLKAAGIGNKQDRKDIAWDIFHAVQAGNEQAVHTLTAELRQGEHANAQNLVAVIRAKLKKCHNSRNAAAVT